MVEATQVQSSADLNNDPITKRRDLSTRCQKILEKYTDELKLVPGLVFAAVGRDGESLASACSGETELGTRRRPDFNTTFWLASLTKLLTGIICLQSVERGEVVLDDSRHLYQYCPELKDTKVLLPDGGLVEKEHDITLRMLLSHTAGFGYEFFSKTLNTHYRPKDLPFATYTVEHVLKMPLVDQPGQRWQYGSGIEWAGIYCERAAGTSLNGLLRQGIAEPLGLRLTGLLVTEEMKANLATMHYIPPGETYMQIGPQAIQCAVDGIPAGSEKQFLQSGGSGGFGNPSEYADILAVLLNNGISPKTKKRLLKPESVQELFTNQIPHLPDFGRQGMGSASLADTYNIQDILPQEGKPPQGMGLGGMLLTQQDIDGRRSAGSGSWFGLANLYYFVDRQKGVAAVLGSQILPCGYQPVLECFEECERALYAGMGSSD